MNTNKVFIGEVNLSLSVTYNGTLYDYFVGEGVEQVVKRKSVNYIIAKKIPGKRVKDLKTKKIYSFELPTEAGKLYVSPRLLPFNYFTTDMPKRLSKRKVLTRGNQIIDNLNKNK